MQDTPTTNRWTKRSFLGIPLIAWALLAMAGTALAVSYFWVTLGATGTITIGDGTDVQFTATPAVVTDGSNCTAEVTGPKSIAIDVPNLQPGDFCEIAVEVENISDPAVDAAFNGFGMANNPSEVPHFYAQSGDDGNGNPLLYYCGTPVPANGTPVTVVVRLNTGNPLPGASYEFRPLEDGFMFVPQASYVSADCS